MTHTEEKQHVCPDCDQRFARASYIKQDGYLKRHKLTHTEEKQHACPDCGKRFERASYIKQHMLIYTGETRTSRMWFEVDAAVKLRCP